MELLRDEEREEDGLLPDWTVRLDVPVLPQEKSGGAGETERAAGAGTETEGPLAGTETEMEILPSGPEGGAAVRSAETGVWDALDGVPGLGQIEEGPERPKKLKNDGENGYSDALNGGIWLDETVERRTADGASDGRRQDETVGLEPEAALDRLARALGSPGDVLPETARKDRTERTAGAEWPDGTAPEVTGWALGGPEGTKAFAELGRAAQAEADSGVEWLYRQTARAEWQTAPAAGAVSAARLAEPGSGSAALTVEELDRAVRRDSRRYDGEMSIY